MSDDNDSSDYKLYYTGTELDDEGYYCTENVHVEQEFFGDSKDYDLLSANAPKLSEWKDANASVSVGFNQCSRELHDQLRNELSHVTSKLKIACGSQIVTFEDLVDVKYGADSEIMKAFLSSGMPSFKNNHENCVKILGTFMFCCSFGFSSGDTLKENSIVYEKLAPEVKIKLMAYEEYVRAWNEIAKSGMKKARTPNHKIITSPGMIPFGKLHNVL